MTLCSASMSPLEIAANFFNLLSVWFSARNSVHTWWSGIVGCALYAVLFTDVKLYADVSLQFFFVGSCIVGWWAWLRGGRNRTPLPITRVRPLIALGLAVLAASAAGGYGLLLVTWTDASYPFIDSAVLALSILAQLLMVARKIESWPVWLVVDLIAVPLYASKGLWLTAGVYAFFLVLVVMGWLRWRSLIAEQRAPRALAESA